jgi:hypothetical protein
MAAMWILHSGDSDAGNHCMLRARGEREHSTLNRAGAESLIV